MDIQTALSISAEIAPQVEKMTDALIDALAARGYVDRSPGSFRGFMSMEIRKAFREHFTIMEQQAMNGEWKVTVGE